VPLSLSLSSFLLTQGHLLMLENPQGTNSALIEGSGGGKDSSIRGGILVED